MQKVLLECDHLQKAIGDRILLDVEHLAVREGDRIGLIGANGAGKTTLLRLLAGEIEADTGEIHRYAGAAMIHQFGTAEEIRDHAAQSLFQAQTTREGLSGGEKTRGRIAEAISAHTQLLLADEPTTDLDVAGIELLKKQLISFPGGLLMISHDRDLLNQVCRTIWYLENSHITVFPGSYDNFVQELERKRAFQQFEYDQYRAEEHRLKVSMQRMQERTTQVRKAPSRMGNSEARLHKREATDAILRISHAKHVLQNRVDHLEKKERPADLPEIAMTFGAGTPLQARTALEADRLNLTAGGKVLLSNACLVLPTGSHTALTGDNGCGKTTLLRALLAPEGLSSAISFHGRVRLNPAVKVGWFEQEHERMLAMDADALSNVRRMAGCGETEARTVLARLNMKRDDALKTVSVLSGGERVKVVLAGLLLSDINLLVLDEPTNHLDVFTMEALEELLGHYAATLLFVSHDRTFIRKVATRVAVLSGRSLTCYEGTLSDMERDQRQDQDTQRLQTEITTLQMRQAALAARMASPQKGEDPLTLNQAYQDLAAEILQLRRRMEK